MFLKSKNKFWFKKKVQVIHKNVPKRSIKFCGKKGFKMKNAVLNWPILHLMNTTVSPEYATSLLLKCFINEQTL